MRAIIYTRVSSDQTGHGRSVESQEAVREEARPWEVRLSDHPDHLSADRRDHQDLRAHRVHPGREDPKFPKDPDGHRALWARERP